MDIDVPQATRRAASADQVRRSASSHYDPCVPAGKLVDACGICVRRSRQETRYPCPHDAIIISLPRTPFAASAFTFSAEEVP